MSICTGNVWKYFVICGRRQSRTIRHLTVKRAKYGDGPYLWGVRLFPVKFNLVIGPTRGARWTGFLRVWV